MSLGGAHSPGTPARCDPTPPAPDPAPTSKLPSPDGGPHSPLSDNGGDSSPASEVAGQGPREYMFAGHRATASCSCCLIQHLTSGDLKNDCEGGLTSPMTLSESQLRSLGRDSGVYEEDTTWGNGGGEAEESLDPGPLAKSEWRWM